MGKLAGGALKLLQTAIYALTFCAAAIVLGFYSYFLAVQADRNVDIPRWEKAVEGMSGAACLYLIFAVILTCCVGGLTFFAFLAIILDIAFTGAFVAIAVLTRDGVRSCDASTVYTPIGNGAPDSKNGWGDDEKTYSVHLGLACKYNKAAFACSIAGALLFLIAALVQLFLGRHHQREKRFGPSPSNNYTSGSGKRKFWQRRSGPKTTRDAELAAAGGLAAEKHHTIRPSHDTGYTGSTVAPATATYDSHGKPVTPPNNHIHTNGGGYHTAPSVNPYGYDNVRNSATNY